MRTRMAVSVVLVVVCFAAAGFGRPYEWIQTDRNVGLFNNSGEKPFAGLRVVFTSEIVPLQAIGIGTDLELLSNEAGILTFTGTVHPFGTFEIDWSLGGPRIDAAFWIDADGVEWAIDVHSPHARMRFHVPPGSDEPKAGCAPYVPIDIEFAGTWSKDPDGLSIVRYQWSWSDGVQLEGETVTRTFWVPGDYTVILTVWDAEGFSDSQTETLHIYRYRCTED